MKVFKEEQRFTKLWIILIIAISTLIPLGIIIKDYSDGNKAYSTATLILIIFLIMLPFTIIFIFKLTTKIDETGIYYQFFPFHFSSKKIAWSELNSAKVKIYDPIGDFGGWGFRTGFLFNKSKGKAMNVSGDIGIQLEFKNGKKLLIGTQKENEAKSVLETYQNKIL